MNGPYKIAKSVSGCGCGRINDIYGTIIEIYWHSIQQTHTMQTKQYAFLRMLVITEQGKVVPGKKERKWVFKGIYYFYLHGLTSLRLDAQQLCLIFQTTAATRSRERKQLQGKSTQWVRAMLPCLAPTVSNPQHPNSQAPDAVCDRLAHRKWNVRKPWLADPSFQSWLLEGVTKPRLLTKPPRRVNNDLPQVRK